MERGGYIYFMTNSTNTTLYVGVTSQLYIRIRQHKESFYPESFTSKYKCFKFVYYEGFPNIVEAIAREKSIKDWKREWKNELIQSKNPKWEDITELIIDL